MAKGGLLGPKTDAAFAYDKYIGFIPLYHAKRLVPSMFD
jgi:hypothetical protein